MGARQSGSVSLDHETDLDQEATQLLLVWQASFKHAIGVIRYVLNIVYTYDSSDLVYGIV